MANTLNDLIPDLYEALDVVSRELTGFLAAVSRSSSIERAALDEEVIVPVTGAHASANNTPGVTAPNTGDTTVDNVKVTISKSKHVPVRWNGEETKGLQNGGVFSSIQADRFYQAMRTLVNEIEADLWLESYKRASRGYGGTAGTAPFNTANDLSDFAGALRILEENGAPTNDLQLVLGHSAMANLRGKQSMLAKVNEAGSSDMLRNGMTDRIMGFALRHSHAVGIHVAGAGAGYDVDLNPAGYAVGDKIIHLDGGTVNTTGIKAGDLVTFGSDPNKYNVLAGTTDIEADITIGGPGLLQTLADATEMTIIGSHTANVAFARSAIVLATRSPATPQGGDSADDVTTIVDPRTGLAFEIAVYRQFLQVVYHVRLAWGFRAIKPDHIGVLYG